MKKNQTPKEPLPGYDHDFWIRMSKTRGYALARDDLETVYAFWLSLPYFMACGDATVIQDASTASRLLRTAAESRGLDSSLLDRASGIYLRFAGGPFRGHKCLPANPSTWPWMGNCLDAFSGRPKPTKQEREVVQAALELLSRLVARLDNEPAAGAGGPGAKADEPENAKSEMPSDPVSTTTAIRIGHTSRQTLKRFADRGLLHPYKPPHSGKTASRLWSESEIRRLFSRPPTE